MELAPGAGAATGADQPTRRRRLAEYMVRRLERSSDRSAEQMMKVSGWLTASLLAINGAGAVTSMNIAGKVGEAELPAALFATGIIFALLSAVTIQGVAELMLQPIENLVAFWNDVALTGDYDESAEARAREGLERAERWRWVCPVLGWISGIMFLMGGFSLAGEVRSHERAVSAKCAALEHDMLLRHPARADSRELYVALHCGE